MKKNSQQKLFRSQTRLPTKLNQQLRHQTTITEQVHKPIAENDQIRRKTPNKARVQSRTRMKTNEDEQLCRPNNNTERWIAACQPAVDASNKHGAYMQCTTNSQRFNQSNQKPYNKTSMGCIYVCMYGTKVFQKLKVRINAFYAALHKSMKPTCTTLELVPPNID